MMKHIYTEATSTKTRAAVVAAAHSISLLILINYEIKIDRQTQCDERGKEKKIASPECRMLKMINKIYCGVRPPAS